MIRWRTVWILILAGVASAPLSVAAQVRGSADPAAADQPLQVDTVRSDDGGYEVHLRFADRQETISYFPDGRIRRRTIQTATTHAIPAGAERTAIAAATALVAAEQLLRSIWAGYWSEQHAFAIYPVRGRTMVVWPDSAAGPGSPLPPGELPRELRGRAFLVDRTLSVPFELEFSVGDRSIAAVSVIPPFTESESRTYTADVPWLADPRGTMIAFVAHEGFHTHQLTRFVRVNGSTRDGPAAEYTLLRANESLFDEGEIIEALERERGTLKDALLAEDADSARGRIAAYLVQKEQRLGRMPSGFRAFEDAHERMEGTAHWVGYEAVRLAIGLAQDATRRHLLSDLEGGVSGSGPAGSEGYSQWHLYRTGAAKAELLRRWGPDDWQRQVEEGALLDDLIRAIAAIEQRCGGCMGSPERGTSR